MVRKNSGGLFNLNNQMTKEKSCRMLKIQLQSWTKTDLPGKWMTFWVMLYYCILKGLIEHPIEAQQTDETEQNENAENLSYMLNAAPMHINKITVYLLISWYFRPNRFFPSYEEKQTMNFCTKCLMIQYQWDIPVTKLAATTDASVMKV